MTSNSSVLWVALSIMITVIIANISYQKISSYIAKSDFYLNSIDRNLPDEYLAYRTGPALKLGFLHMRKAGGTHIDTIINEFMMEHNCITETERVGVRGIKAGVPLDMLRKRNYTEPSKCPRVNYVHEETTCAEGVLLLDLPNRSLRKDQFALLTTLRDPIERIGSQAFYSGKSIGHHIIIDMLFSNPLEACSMYRNMTLKDKSFVNPTAVSSQCKTKQSGIAKAKACLCFEDTLAKAMSIIRVNETMWFEWMKNVGYVDEYMPNYFVRRLVRSTNSRKKAPDFVVRAFNRSKSCLMDPEKCSRKNQYAILKDVFPVLGGCSKPGDKQYNVTFALEVAKSLLQNQFDFIITEYFAQEKTLNAVRTSLHNPFDPPSSFMERRDNGGMHTNHQDVSSLLLQLKATQARLSASASVKRKSITKNVTHSEVAKSTEHKKVEKLRRRRLSDNIVATKPPTSYRGDIPPGILAHLEKENAADIELYKFALKLFEERAKNENWV